MRAEITLNLKDADISTLIATVSEVTGKNFIVDARVTGAFTRPSKRLLRLEIRLAQLDLIPHARSRGLGALKRLADMLA